MLQPFTAVKRWGRKTFHALQAIEAAMDYRYEDYAQARFDRIERRIAALEKPAALPFPTHHDADRSLPMTEPTPNRSNPSAPPATGVFALLKPKPGVTREQVMALMPLEIRATVQLYLEGKIREWHAREDGKGAVFLVNTGDVAEAKALMESLPLSKKELLDHEYIPVGPLMPLRLLLAGGDSPAGTAAAAPAPKG